MMPGDRYYVAIRDGNFSVIQYNLWICIELNT